LEDYEMSKVNDLKDKTIGFLGLGAMGLPICKGLVKSGYTVIIPTFRKDNPNQPAEKNAAKNEGIAWMLENGAKPSNSQKELLEQSDILIFSLPKSQHVEATITGKDGVWDVCKPGTLIIDMTSADATSTQKLAKLLEEKNIDLLDAPVSGGSTGAEAQTLTIMVGGKQEVFEKSLPILNTIGNPDKVMYMGPSGSGDLIKCANNFLSACCAAATTEALAVCAKAGIEPHKAIEVIASSGGMSQAATFKFPKLIFPGKGWNFTVGLMGKDVGLFNSAAKDMQVPSLFGNLTSQILTIPIAEEGENADCMAVQKLYERWADVELCGIDKE
jgi:3-hydroxyisobutyrate dehydrogenase-like beta-hydroxyacid dehydrogenase